MAKLSDFLGGLASGICDAKVNSDLQSLRIAEEYAKNDLLKHFSVPRMRIDKVELNIPVAIGNLVESTQKRYQPINKSAFLAKANERVINSLTEMKLSISAMKKLKETVDNSLIPAIEDSVNTLDEAIRLNQNDDVLKIFSNNVGLKTAEFLADFYKKSKLNISTVELNKLKNKVVADLQSQLKEEIVLNPQVKMLDSIDVIVESDKLREIKPENVIMIKMTISEQGMEWVSMEDKDGQTVNKLMPE